MKDVTLLRLVLRMLKFIQKFLFISDNFSSNGYSTSPPLPITPIIFQFHTEPLNANAALAECQKTFGHMIGTLLRIRNQETADYMAEYLKNAEGKCLSYCFFFLLQKSYTLHLHYR